MEGAEFGEGTRARGYSEIMGHEAYSRRRVCYNAARVDVGAISPNQEGCSRKEEFGERVRQTEKNKFLV